jgi:hypothetical protein
MQFGDSHLRFVLDERLAVRDVRLDDRHALLANEAVPLLSITRQHPDAPTPERTYDTRDFRWHEIVEPRAGWRVVGRTPEEDLGVTVRIKPEPNGVWASHVTITNVAGAPVQTVAFTPLSSIPAAALAAMRLAVPHGAGCVLPAGRLRDGDRIALRYPVHASMQWTDVLVDEVGVYLACLDADVYLKQLLIERRHDTLAVWWQYTDLLIAEGQTLTLPPFAIAGHADGWPGAASLYRAWARQWFHDAEPPDWFAQCPAWAWVAMRDQHADEPRHTYDDIARLTQRLEAFGRPTAQVAGWMRHGHDADYPDFEPAPDLGGSDRLAGALQTAHEARRRVALYTNARLIDPASRFASRPDWQDACVELAPCARRDAQAASGTFVDDPPEPAKLDESVRAAAWDPDRVLAKEQYGRVVFAVGCPGSALRREHFVERLGRIARAFRPDGIYLDQACGCSALPCYAFAHDHARPALAWARYREFLRQVREAVRYEHPACYIATEGVNDALGDSIDAFQAHNDWSAQVLGIGQDTPELFRVTFPRRLLLIGPIWGTDTRYLRLGHALGAGFDLATPFDPPADPAFAARVRNVLELRRTLAPLICGAEPVLGDVRVSPGGVRAMGLLKGQPGPTGSLLINGAWLPADDPDAPLPAEPFTLTVTIGRPPTAATLYHESGETEPVPLQRTPGAVRIQIRPAEIFSVLLTWPAGGGATAKPDS